MSTSYTALLSLVIFIILFLYFSWISVSLMFVKEKEKEENKSILKNKKVPWEWHDLIDAKNKNLSFIDLGNHILIVGIILFAIFIIKNV